MMSYFALKVSTALRNQMWRNSSGEGDPTTTPVSEANYKVCPTCSVAS